MSAIRVFTPSWADEANTNAQNLTVKEIVSRLDPARFHVTMFTQGPPDPRIANRPNTTLIPWRAHGNAARALVRLSLAPPDVYFYPRETPIDAGLLSMRRTLARRTALVTHVVKTVSPADAVDRSTLAARTFARTARSSAQLFGNSEHVARTVNESFGLECGVIHNGVDRRHFFPTPREPREGPTRILCVGSLQARKRPMTLLRIAQTLPTCNFRLVGAGDEEGALRERIRVHDLKNVTLVGPLSPKEVGNEMRAADLFVFPSVVEGHPQVLAQAAACGLPAIAMATYRPDAIVDGETGHLCADDGALVRAVEALVRDASLRAKMGERAVLHAARFDWDVATAMWARAIESAAGGH